MNQQLSPRRTSQLRGATSLSNNSNHDIMLKTPRFIQCILLFVVMIVIILLVVTYHTHLNFENLPTLPQGYTPKYFVTNTDETILEVEDPSHVPDVLNIINDLTFHPDDVNTNNNDNNPNPNTNTNTNSNNKCGDIESTKKIFESLNVISDSSKIHIWPLPQSYTLFENIVSINVLELQFESNTDHIIIKKAINRYKNIMFPHKTNRKHDGTNTINKIIIYVSDQGKNDELNVGFNEEYELIIHDPSHEDSCNEILLRSATIYGSLRGLETLSQLITYSFYTDEYRTNIGIIKDYPRFIHRGVLLDTSRHFHPVIAIKRFLLSLSFVKYNIFHWHIVDEESFPYESKVYPNLWNGSYSEYERYSENDILDIIEYASELGIRVIPEFDTPGHAGSWCVGYPQLCIKTKCTRKGHPPHLLDPSKPFTFQLIDGLFNEATKRFNDNYFHLGSDEVVHECYQQDNDIKIWSKNNNIAGKKGVYKYFVEKTGKIVEKYNRRPIVWNEVYDSFNRDLSRNYIIQLWQGGERQKRQTIINQGFDIIISYGWYLDHLGNKWEEMYNKNDPEEGITSNHEHILGGESCMWSETVDLSNLLSTVWPKAATTAERLWSNKNVKDINSARKRYKYLRCLLIRRGIGASPTINKQSRQAPPIQNSCLQQ